LETTATSKIQGGAKTAHGWPVRHQKGETAEVTVEIKTNNIVNEIDRRALVSSEATARLIETQAHLAAKTFDATPPKIRELAIPIPDRRRVSREKRSGREFWLAVRIGALVSAFGLGWITGSNLYSYFDRGDEITDRSAVNAVVERIIAAESNGDPNLKNSHSSATGLGQFLDDAWLDLIRQYRPDLTKGRSESETLELRREAKLAREITMRSVERNAAILKHRGLPVTAGAIYLAHFAGPAGAVAILSASENADAALVMASADTTGRTKHQQLIKANPFLEHLTVADLKVWADRKMRGLDLHPTEVRAVTVRQ
jgi:hypothetical protein